MEDTKRNRSRSHSRKKRKSRRLRRQLFILLFVAFILTGGYFYINYYPKDKAYNITNDEANTEYTLVENHDSLNYKAIVIYHKNIDINTISNTFYKSDLFWPYIFIENKNVINNPLNIEKDVALKIPRLSDSILNLKNPSSIEHVKLLADSILENVNEPI